jgi:SAM-dependent methyltransferase
MDDEAQRLEATKRYYDENARAYAANVALADLSDLWNAFAYLLPTGGVVLDVGCGGGRDLKALTSRGLHAMGLDYSSAMAEVARVESDRPVVVGDLRSFDFGTGRFDGVWAVAALLHVPRHEIPGLLRRVYLGLRVPGVFLTSMQSGRGIETSADGRLFELYLPDQWQELLQCAGFHTRAGPIKLIPSRRAALGQVSWFVTIGIKGEP